MPNIIETISNHSEDILSAIGAASVLASFTKTKWDNLALNWIAALIHVTAFNFKSAKAATENTTVKIAQPSTLRD